MRVGPPPGVVVFCIVDRCVEAGYKILEWMSKGGWGLRLQGDGG
jgi:hypothetical protein